MSRATGRILVILLAVTSALFVGCSASSQPEVIQGVSSSSPEPVPTEAVEAIDGAPSTPAADADLVEDQQDASPTPVPEEEPAPAEPAARRDGPLVFAGLDVEIIGVTTPATGGGSRPVLEWLPVDGATRYEVSLYAPSGDIYWAWSGSVPRVPVGGEPVLGPNSAGPAVIPEMTWYVLALDEIGLIIGQSPLMNIAP